MVRIHLTEAKIWEVRYCSNARQKQSNDFDFILFFFNGPCNGKLIGMINACGRDKRSRIKIKNNVLFNFQVCWRNGRAGLGMGRDGFSQRAPLDIRQKIK